MKFIDKEIQEDFDLFSEHRKQKFINDWLERKKWREENAEKPKILFVREWLERKRKQRELENDSLLPVALNVSGNSLSYELESFTPKPTHAIQFEIIDRKLVSTMVKIGKD